MSQEKCHYCNDDPDNKANVQKSCKAASEYAKTEGDFLYNGLDRLNSDLLHDFNNVVTCCFKCNAAKHNLTLDEFDEWIIRTYNHMFK
jgi:hypothetical protein